MPQPGIGAILHQLSGGSQHDAGEYYGQSIRTARFADDAIWLTFENGKSIKIFDDGQSCCESRYMTTSDDVAWLVGKTLIGIETKAAPDVEDDYGVHEAVFLEIKTNEGCIAFESHNEHNGYYGGFGLTIDEVEAA